MRQRRIIVDSSIWIDHINMGDPDLTAILKHGWVVMHPMVYGEIALGSITKRQALLRELRKLPQVEAASHSEVIAMIEWMELYNKGVGLIDAHLLASTRILPNGTLMTRDKRLQMQAERLGVAYQP